MLCSSAVLSFQVVLEGQWQQGYLALAAIGATNIGSIEVILSLCEIGVLCFISSGNHCFNQCMLIVKTTDLQSM